ncbi:hypothetical protein [Maribacter halichondriae]|uniref:hypothetical protein n=1 Tax=Maribacter halichondriae TaxID=2980554 RepID=UPI002359D695|nr:hypothetical protein [Maribacter sp. Hal144]
MKYSLGLAFFLILVSCGDKKNTREIEKIDFETEYLFNAAIENKIELDTTTDSHFTGFKYQVGASDYATKGDYENALATWDLAMKTSVEDYTPSEIDSINDNFKKIKALDYIVEKSKLNQVVIINEAHHNSFHRVFTKSLLQKLYDNGYKNLGLEALGNGQYEDSLLNRRKYPVQNTGFYIKDPQFGNLVRTALEIGYHVFPYEAISGADASEREIEQAKNIQKVIESKPNEKFLIHCGFGHVLEGNYEAWGKTMAGRLTEFISIDPLTINQVQFSEKSKPEYNHPLLKALKIEEPTVLLDGQNNPYRYERGESWADIAVFHPTTDFSEGRPDWLFEDPNLRVPMILEDLDISFPVMVLAFKKGEEIKEAIPIDIVEVQNKTDEFKLALKKSSYNIVSVNEKGEARKFELMVEL